MLCSLFSIFDPSCHLLSFSLQFKWVSVMFCMFLLNWQYFFSLSGYMLMFNQISNLIIGMIKLSFSKSYKSVVLLIMSLFFFLLSLGEFGMIPYTFVCTSHLSFNLSISLPLWVGGMVYMFTCSWKKFFSHFVPLGCPAGIIPFIVIVETLSSIIRPFSLSIRLMSNIMAGHLVMTLLGGIISSLLSYTTFLGGLLLISFQSVLVLFEMGVAFIQAYVFMNLISMYWQENND